MGPSLGRANNNDRHGDQAQADAIAEAQRNQYRYPPAEGIVLLFSRMEVFFLRYFPVFNDSVTVAIIVISFLAMYFGNHFVMGGQQFPAMAPEGYLFGDLADLNFLAPIPGVV
jgi:hypothetical protein